MKNGLKDFPAEEGKSEETGDLKYGELASQALNNPDVKACEEAYKKLYSALNSDDENTRKRAAEELAAYFGGKTDGDKMAKDFDAKMRAIGAAEKVSSNLKNANNILPIELNENIQILLDFHQKSNISDSQIMDITGKSLDELRKYTGPKFKNAFDNSAGNRSRGGSGITGTGRANGATRVNAAGNEVTGGNRYKGVYKAAPASVSMQQVRGEMAGKERIRKMPPLQRIKAWNAMESHRMDRKGELAHIPSFVGASYEEASTESMETRTEAENPYANMKFEDKKKELINLANQVELSRRSDKFTAEECVGFVNNLKAIRSSVAEEAQESGDSDSLKHLVDVDKKLEEIELNHYESVLNSQIVRNGNALDLETENGWQILQDAKEYVHRERIAFQERPIVETEEQMRYRMLLEEQQRLANESSTLAKQSEKLRNRFRSDLKETVKSGVKTYVDMKYGVGLDVAFGTMMAGVGADNYQSAAMSGLLAANMADNMYKKVTDTGYKMFGDRALDAGIQAGSRAFGAVAGAVGKKIGKNGSSSNPAVKLSVNRKRKDPFRPESVFRHMKAKDGNSQTNT